MDQSNQQKRGEPDQEQAQGQGGQPHAIRMDDKAIAQARQFQQENQAWQDKALRLYIEGKGCDGFYYGVTFDEAHPEDLRFPQTSDGRLEVLVDPDTIEFVTDSEITWVDDERGRGFLVQNPHHRQFRGKFYKRRAWQDKLLEKIKEKSSPPQGSSTTQG